MAGAVAEARWKALFRERLALAHGHLSMTVLKIGNARGSLAAPVRAPATDATRARIQRAERALEDASDDLFAAASLLGSAEELALRGGADAPWYPLPSVGRLRASSAAQRRASRKIREAMVFAAEAYQDVQRCRVFLLGLRLLLDHPLLPRLDEYLHAQRRNAFDLLEGAMGAANDCVSRVKSARQDLPGGWPI